jgi:hypothetical protein
MEDVHQPGRILEQNGINMEDVLSTWINIHENKMVSTGTRWYHIEGYQRRMVSQREKSY